MTNLLLSSFVADSSELRQTVADHLGMPSVANLPEDCGELAKGLGLLPAAQVVAYEPVKGKSGPGLYLVSEPFAKGQSGGKCFSRIADEGVPLTPGIVNTVCEAADKAQKVATALRDLADSMADAVDGPSE